MELNQEQGAFRDAVQEILLDHAMEILPYRNSITVMAQVAVNIDGEMFSFQVNTDHNRLNMRLFSANDTVFEDTSVVPPTPQQPRVRRLRRRPARPSPAPGAPRRPAQQQGNGPAQAAARTPPQRRRRNSSQAAARTPPHRRRRNSSLLRQNRLLSTVRRDEDGNFVCEFCGLAFSRRDGMYVHQRKRHGRESRKKRVRNVGPCVCEHCGRRLSRPCHLRRHIRTIHRDIA